MIQVWKFLGGAWAPPAPPPATGLESHHCSRTISQPEQNQINGTETYLRHQRYNPRRNYYNHELLLFWGLYRPSQAISRWKMSQNTEYLWEISTTQQTTILPPCWLVSGCPSSLALVRHAIQDGGKWYRSMQGENEWQWKKLNENTYEISSMKRVTKKFLDVSHVVVVQNNGKEVQKKCAARASLLFCLLHL